MVKRTEKDSQPRRRETSWEKVGDWYHGIVGKSGHHYHQSLILPHLLKVLKIKDGDKVSFLDLACGQGILARYLPASLSYTGVDLSLTLIKAAKSLNKNPTRQFLVGDVSKKLELPERAYDFAAIILALQNIERGDLVVKHAADSLKIGGKLAIVLNHPCFRIPRQSSWEIDEGKKLRYRRIDRYQSDMKIPIQMHPSQGKDSQTTWSFHHTLSTYSRWIAASGFVIETIDELSSNKESQGKNSPMENRSRQEIPLFMTIIAKKIEA